VGGGGRERAWEEQQETTNKRNPLPEKTQRGSKCFGPRGEWTPWEGGGKGTGSQKEKRAVIQPQKKKALPLLNKNREESFGFFFWGTIKSQPFSPFKESGGPNGVGVEDKKGKQKTKPYLNKGGKWTNGGLGVNGKRKKGWGPGGTGPKGG